MLGTDSLLLLAIDLEVIIGAPDRLSGMLFLISKIVFVPEVGVVLGPSSGLCDDLSSLKCGGCLMEVGSLLCLLVLLRMMGIGCSFSCRFGRNRFGPKSGNDALERIKNRRDQ